MRVLQHLAIASLLLQSALAAVRAAEGAGDTSTRSRQAGPRRRASSRTDKGPSRAPLAAGGGRADDQRPSEPEQDGRTAEPMPPSSTSSAPSSTTLSSTTVKTTTLKPSTSTAARSSSSEVVPAVQDSDAQGNVAITDWHPSGLIAADSTSSKPTQKTTPTTSPTTLAPTTPVATTVKAQHRSHRTTASLPAASASVAAATGQTLLNSSLLTESVPSQHSAIVADWHPQGLQPSDSSGSEKPRKDKEPAASAPLTTPAQSAPDEGTKEVEKIEEPTSPPRPVAQVPADVSQAPLASRLPQDFARVERGKDWDGSPYVSQAHLGQLWQSLFKDYVKEVPPVPLDGGALPVGVGLNFVKFKGFDAVSGTMDITLNLRLCWDDPRLSFKAQDFFNMTWVHDGDKLPIRSDIVWTPDITVLNQVGALDQLLDIQKTPLVLSDDSFREETGVNVLWSRPLDVKSNCEVDMSRYPFDEQHCYLVVGSWASSSRQMLLVPQPFFAEYSVHSSEFRVQNITVEKREVYTKGSIQMFTEVVYHVTLLRYPHYYVVNFILPMIAITLLTVATMWMSPGNVGPRVNSATKLLLCVVSIIFITARQRPAIHGDIWLDRFQSHCLALAMSSVLESLFIDWMLKTPNRPKWLARVENIDWILRGVICYATTYTVFADAQEVRGTGSLRLYTSWDSPSSSLLITFIYIVFFGLLSSATWSLAWIFMPRQFHHWLLGRLEEEELLAVEAPSCAEPPETLSDPVPCKARRQQDSAGALKMSVNPWKGSTTPLRAHGQGDSASEPCLPGGRSPELSQARRPLYSSVPAQEPWGP